MKNFAEQHIINMAQSPLREMAYSFSQIEQKLSYGESVRDTHLLKIFYFRDYTDFLNGWIDTVFKLANRTYRDSGNHNKFPKENKLYKCLFGDKEDSFFDHLIASIEDFNYKQDKQYSDLPVIIDTAPSKVFEFCKKYYTWLAKQLSQKGAVTFKEVIIKIQTLLKEIPYTI